MTRFLLVCLAGAAGTGARYLLGGWVQRTLAVSFPFGTITVNVIGSFLISIIMYLGLEKQVISPDLRVVLVTGVLGGFTTYSSFNYETLRLVQDGAWVLALLNLGATTAACLAAGGIGLVLARVAA